MSCYPNNTILIYFSPKDKSWIAHSLNMDLVGTGETPDMALREVRKEMRLIRYRAAHDMSVIIYRDVSSEIQSLARNAIELEPGIYLANETLCQFV